MSESLTTNNERKLRFDGPNYTADAIIIDEAADQLLLIQRGDTGKWALPGGFIDPSDSSAAYAATREASEEANLNLEPSQGQLVFSGVVDDPRNSGTAWIETSAYLFSAQANEGNERAGDDAMNVQWFPLAALPSLYASHHAITVRALEAVNSKRQLAINNLEIATLQPIDGGHMNYRKYTLSNNERTIFYKEHSDHLFTDQEKATRSREYLAKEAAIMGHLRSQGFASIPRSSHLENTRLAMDYFSSDDNWHWRAPDNDADTYIDSVLRSFDELESIPLPADVFPIESSLESFQHEGWQSIDDEKINDIAATVTAFMPRIASTSQELAVWLLSELASLRHLVKQTAPPREFVFCHHDARQANIAWHPEHGTKLIDWSWASLGEPNSDHTMFLIDLDKSDFDVSRYHHLINKSHCLQLLGFWLNHATWPAHNDDDTVRFQQFLSALSAFRLLQV